MLELRRRAIWLVIPCVLFIVGSCALMVTGIGALRHVGVDTKLTSERLLATERVLDDIIAAESGQRGYLLTGDDQYLVHYEQALDRLSASTEPLDRLLSDPGAPEAVSLSTLVGAKLSELAETVRLAREGRQDEALAIVRSGRGTVLMDQISREIAVVRQQSQDLLIRRAAAGTRVLWWTGAASITLGSGALVLAVLMGIALWRTSLTLRRQDEQLDLALSAASAGEWRFDPVSHVAYWSPQIFTMVGMPQPSAGGSGRLSRMDTWRAFVHPDDMAPIEEQIRSAVKTRQPFRAEYRMIRPDGETRWLSVAGQFLTDESTMMSGLAIDITAKKQAAEKLAEAQAAVARAGEAKSRFLAAASHDLRQPLQSMFLFVTALQGLIVEGRPRLIVDQLMVGMELLHDLLDRLLHVSRLDAGKVEINVEIFPIGSLIEEIAASFAPVAEKKGLNLVALSSPAIVQSDRTLLGQILRNLVNNAIRYTERGKVEIICSVAGKRLSIMVRDTGVGIPREQIARIWEEFHQVRNEAHNGDLGVGLGLAIVRRLSALLDHPVQVMSKPGQGSTFMVDVPLAEAGVSRPCKPALRAVAPQGDGRLALIVEDDTLVLEGLAELAAEWGYRVMAAGSMLEAMAKLDCSDRPQIMLCDYRLGEGGTGLDVITKVREVCGSAIPGILITGDTEAQLPDTAAEQGVGVLYKPVSPDELARAVRARAA